MRTSRPQNKARKDGGRLRKYMASKLSVTVFIIGLALVALLAKIFWIQRTKAEEYNKIVLSQRQAEYESRTIPYRRGDI